MSANKPTETTPVSPESVLVSLRDKVMLSLGMTHTTLKMAVDKFVRENMQTTGSKTHYIRGNTYNEFTTDKMTIKVFYKFLRIIGIESVEFSVRVRTKTGRQAQVSSGEISLSRQLATPPTDTHPTVAPVTPVEPATKQSQP